MGIAFFWAASRQLDMLGLNTSIHKQIREDVCQYMSNLDKDNKKELEESIPGRDLEDYLQKIVIEFFSNMMDNQMMKIIDFDSEDIVIGSNTTKATIYLGYDSKSEHYISIEPLKSNPTSFDRGTFDTNVKIGQYYAADYVDRFYIR